MRPRIAVPTPHSTNAKYSVRAFEQFERAVEQAGGEAIQIPLDDPEPAVRKLIETCDGVLLPGSPADVEPSNYSQQRHKKTAAADNRRDATDRRLLDDAYQKRKPVLAVCYGLQSLNVYRAGSLVQHIESRVKHDNGKKKYAHGVCIEPESQLAKIVEEAGGDLHQLKVNSSHHQSADVPGEGLRIVSKSTSDGIVEAMEGTDPDHFVLAVQWHPERSVELDEPSRALFQAFVKATKARKAERPRPHRAPSVSREA